MRNYKSEYKELKKEERTAWKKFKEVKTQLKKEGKHTYLARLTDEFKNWNEVNDRLMVLLLQAKNEGIELV